MALKSPSEVHGTSETCGRLRLFNLRKEERDAVSVWDGMRPPDTAVRLDSSYSAASGVAGCRPGCVHRVLCQHRRGHEPSLSICAARCPGRLCSHGVWDSDPGPRAGEGSWRDWLTGAWGRRAQESELHTRVPQGEGGSGKQEAEILFVGRLWLPLQAQSHRVPLLGSPKWDRGSGAPSGGSAPFILLDGGQGPKPRTHHS